LLATVFTILALTEAVSVLAFDRVSKVQQREVSQRQALLAVRDAAATERPHVAVLGNSMLLEGLNVPLLEEKLKPRIVPVPYFVLATNYYDWLFGLKRLFAEGTRPRYVVLGLSPNQLASPGTRGDYSARYLFRGQDLMDVARQTHMNATTTSSFLLSHFSEYYGTRVVVRGFVMGRVLPSVDEMMHNLNNPLETAPISVDLLSRLAAERLKALDELCRANDARFVLVIPPSNQQGAEAIAQTGRGEHVKVLVPVANDELDRSYYQTDGFHLNDKGARFFTERLAANLLDEFLETGRKD